MGQGRIIISRLRLFRRVECDWIMDLSASKKKKRLGCGSVGINAAGENKSMRCLVHGSNCPRLHLYCTRETMGSIVISSPAQPTVAGFGQVLYLVRVHALGFSTLNTTLCHHSSHCGKRRT